MSNPPQARQRRIDKGANQQVPSPCDGLQHVHYDAHYLLNVMHLSE